METYTTGTGQKLLVHEFKNCTGEYCVIHNPSPHVMKDFPTHWREDRCLMERICPHGIGHPDPDQWDFFVGIMGKEKAKSEFIHGCDGCCK